MTDLDRLVESRAPEGPSLEYKQTLELDSQSKRLETLKDLGGLGNGGGGTIIYGIPVDSQNPELPGPIAPLIDPKLPGRLEDIVRAAIRPPLLAIYTKIEQPDGYVLVVEISRSPLGPYMVEGYGEIRYYARVGSRTEPMFERQIRDAYMLAARAREHRPQVWEDHELPLRPLVKTPSLFVSALPEEPLQEVLDVGSVKVEDLLPPADMGALRNRALVPQDLRVWAGGLYGETRILDGSWIRFRLYRDGAIGSAVALPVESPNIPAVTLTRTLHAQLAYIGWLWSKVGLRNLVEIRLDLQHIEAGKLDARGFYGEGDLLVAQRPGDAGPLIVSVRSEEIPNNLCRAGTRHRLVRRFIDQVYQAYGRPRAPAAMFTAGWLHGADGKPVGVSIVGAGLCRGTDALGRIYSDGYVEATRFPQLIGYVVDGILLDRSGNAMAAVEMAVGSGIPDGFVVQAFADDALYSCLAPAPLTSQQARIPPAPTGRWSGQRINDFFQ